MNNHTNLLNFLATTFNLQSYLEIGVQNPTNNFDSIECLCKHGCDPNPLTVRTGLYKIDSDEFFKWKVDIASTFKYDLIFIDGLHHADQVKRDFENSLKCLTDNGFIVLHDTLPEKEEYTSVPRMTRLWLGDVYKFACSLRTYAGIDFCTVNFDYGCTVVWRANKKAKKIKPVNNFSDFLSNKQLLNIVSVEQFKAIKFYEMEITE